MRTLRLPAPAALLALILPLTACGVGVGQQIQQVKVDGGPEATIRMNTLNILDPWGAFLAAVATNDNAVNARDTAIREALGEGWRSGTVSYDYEVVPPRPGRMTVFKFAWGEGGDDTPLDAFEFEMTTGLFNHTFESGLNLGLTLGAHYQSWEAGDDARWSRVAMPLGVSVGVQLGERLHLAPWWRWDPLSTAFQAILGPHWFDHSAGALLTVGLASWLQVHVEGSYLSPSLNDGDDSGRVLQANAALIFVWNPEDD
ncbi:MAG: hypothetical protein KC613_08150 [Myxococcales bacterium]|nr:hypothetical protein [Myxococcales bacterium]MCB9524821.1 hypothetical protein [Myxococcales bacterium]